tara:strand:+ start:1025 stop:2260 length:1236 start_codon:yes stop_codon:yes gene_type:complete
MESTTASADIETKSSLDGRETLNIGIVLPHDERHPVGWLATLALGREIEWRNAPVELQWFVTQTTTPQWAAETLLSVSYLPENIEELEHDLDVLVEFDVTDHTAEFVVDPTSIDLSLHDSIGLLRRYLPPESIDAIHPAPSLKESILVDVDEQVSDSVAAEIARHARSRQLPVTLIGVLQHQASFAAKLAARNQTSTPLGNDLDPQELAAAIQNAAVVITSDVALHQLANVLHGRSVLVFENSDDKEIQHHLWSASANLALLESNPVLEDRVSRLAEIIEQTALLRLNRPITSRSASQERKRNEQSRHLHQQQSTHWGQQRRRAHQSIDALRQESLQLRNELAAARDDADKTRKALRAQHNRLNELETEIARRDQGPARLQRSIDWSSVLAQLERDLVKVLRWLRRRLDRG